jgi:hypothetical protein
MMVAVRNTQALSVAHTLSFRDFANLPLSTWLSIPLYRHILRTNTNLVSQKTLSMGGQYNLYMLIRSQGLAYLFLGTIQVLHMEYRKNSREMLTLNTHPINSTV